MTVTIAGCGDLGIETGLRFAAAGHRVVGLRRRAELVPAPIEGRTADLRGSVPPIDADTSVLVVALAAGSRDVEEYRATYVDGLRNVLDGVDAAGASPRVLLVSSTSATGGSGTGDVLLEAEALLRSRVPGGTVVRLSGIYGPGRTRLVDQVRTGTAVLAPTPDGSASDGSRMTSRIHRDDAAAALVHLASLDDLPPLVIGTDDQPVRLDEVYRFLAASLGVSLDVAPAAGVGGGVPLSNAVLRSTGFTFTYPTYREGYRAVLAGEGVRHR
ncbi:SDR family NAD(P)-dependent oxidoreductase [Curtobacterium sp. PhB136]|uniref:SDR family NAD(P)-dependent oxidoreductase n=1 Tax=Curtobacterium sp. PhB136 TaxID=2485181 RepID=UPI00104FCE43|nr:SDR family NAD(P)-dependent oxidoreductase [Curtobacterium sp. PhB136]TCK62881.1 nucleoside-diphosphate-sugar epimerase [Curtobacterium sp. PhB136]